MNNPNGDCYRTKCYLLADPKHRLFNGKCYRSVAGDDFIHRTLSDSEMQEYVITELCMAGHVVEIEEHEEWHNDGHRSWTETYYEIVSNIDPIEAWDVEGDCLDYGNISSYVMRRKYSDFWKTFDPHKLYRILEYDRSYGLLYLCDAKDEYGNDIANLEEYVYHFPDEIELVPVGEESNITESTHHKHLIICHDDGGFKLY